MSKSKKMPNFELKYPYLGEFWSKVEIVNTANLICWKLAISCSAFFVTHDADENIDISMTFCKNIVSCCVWQTASFA